MSQLYIRPALNDHEVIAELLAPSPVPTLHRLRPPIARLVVDAHIAGQRPLFARAASDAGVPLLIDPLTPLLQSEVAPRSQWAMLPFASAATIAPDEIEVAGLVERCVQFQIEMGATKIVAPYLCADDPADPAFEKSLELMDRTAQYLRFEGLRIPVTAVFCGQLRSFARQSSLNDGIGRFSRLAAELGVETIALCLTPLGSGEDSYAKISGMVTIATTAMRAGVDVIAWRQGVYGAALCAVGLDGYETGIGLSEGTNIARFQASRRPREKRQSGGAGAGVYFEPIGRSLPLPASNVLLGDVAMRAKLICEDDSCCTDNLAMIDRRREHAVRTRARVLAELNQQPHRQWRLHSIANHALTGITLARQANKVLSDHGVRQQIGVKNLLALRQVAHELALAASEERRA